MAASPSAHDSLPPEEDETTLEAERRVGKTLANKYRLDSLLGVGGMAAVYAPTRPLRSIVPVPAMTRPCTTSAGPASS